MEPWSRGDVLALAAIMIPIIAGIWGLLFGLLTNHKHTRNEFIQTLESTPVLTKYQNLLNALLNKLQAFFGDAESSHAFWRSVQLAYIYPTFFFILAYSWFGGSHQFSGFAVFPEKSEWKVLYFPVITLAAIALATVFIKADKIDAFLIRKLGGEEQLYRILSALATAGLTFTLNDQLWAVVMMVVFGYLYTVFMVAFVGAFAFAFAGAFMFAVVGAVAFVGVGAGVGVGAFAVAVAVIFALPGNYTYSLLFATFFLCFPLINALLDWFSWYISRLFLKQASQETKAYKIALDLFYDSLAAIVFMIMLCLLLPAGAELLNLLYAQFSDAHIDWQTMALTAKNDPWGKGIMVTLMLITTLIPTFIHLFLGLFALLIHSAAGKKLAAYLKKANDTESNTIPFFAALWIEAYGFAVLLAMAGLIWLVLAVTNLPIADSLYWITAKAFNL